MIKKRQQRYLLQFPSQRGNRNHHQASELLAGLHQTAVPQVINSYIQLDGPLKRVIALCEQAGKYL